MQGQAATDAPAASPMPRRRKALYGALTALALLGLCEAGLRLAGVEFSWRVDAPLAREQLAPYIGRGELWSDEEALAASFSIYEDHRTRLWRLRPHLDREIANFLVPPPFRDSTRFRVRTDGRGFRPVPGAGTQEPAGVILFGDSHVFGWGLAPRDALPARLAVELGPGRGRVVNAGQPGYSSLQGLALMEEVLARTPCRVAVAGFGFNDAVRSPQPDREIAGRRASLRGALAHGLRSLRTVRLLQSVLLRPPGAPAEAHGPRVAEEAYRRHLGAMAALCRERGADLVFLSAYNGYRDALAEEARSLGAAVIDADAIERACRKEALARSTPQARAARARAEDTFGAAFLEENPKYLTHADAAHYNAWVHRRLAGALAACVAERLARGTPPLDSAAPTD